MQSERRRKLVRGIGRDGRRSRNRGYVRLNCRRALARQTHLQVAEADLDFAQIVFRHDLCKLVDRSDVDKTLRGPSVCAPDGFFIFSLATGTDAPVNNWAFVYPADPGKESATSRRGSCPARPDADVVKRHAAVRSDAVVAHEDVDSPSVKKGGRRPDAFADEDSRLHALE